MAQPKAKQFSAVLQELVNPGDTEWNYNVAGLPGATQLNSSKLVKLVSLTWNKQSPPKIELRLTKAPSNRVTWNESFDKFLLLSVSDFRLCYPPERPGEGLRPAPIRETSEYLSRLLKMGVSLNGQKYHFFGHSNSQLKSRSCFLYASTKEDVSKKVESMGDFSKMKSVAKKAKRIGLLFSAAEMGVTLPEERCQDIDDVERDGYCFTDGCGFVSEKLARLLVQRHSIAYRNKRYLPSVFQIRYRGYKGVLTLDPTLNGQTAVQFRASMKKFKDVRDLTLSVVDCAKPYAFGYLNDEVVLLLNALHVSTETLLRKQNEYLSFLKAAEQGEPLQTFRFLASRERLDLAEQLLLNGVESVRTSARRLVREEYARMVNRRDEQRCRILVPQSRLLFGICDPSSKSNELPRIPEGCCYVRITKDGDGEARTVTNTEVLVTRNPCSHPGDLRKLKAIDIPEYAHLVDCIVFSVKGKRPGADLMSGGDLDGDKFFVCWDPHLIPSVISEPAQYPGVREPTSFRAITDDDRADYFARYTSASLGRVKNLYLKWARLRGAMSPECQELNRLFSQCVDGNSIKVPPRLEDPPCLDDGAGQFVLDVLHNAAKQAIECHEGLGQELVSNSFEAIDALLGRDQVAISEFELVQFILNWCEQHSVSFEMYIPFFNFSALTDEQQAWLISRLPMTKTTPSMIRNGLLQSSLLAPAELRRFKLDHARLHWRPIFDSATDRMGRFLQAGSRALETFHKKLIILKVDKRLTIGIYVPQRIEKASEAQVDASVRVFAFPRSSGPESVNYCVAPTKKNYRLYFDDNVFQLYNLKRGDTWIFLQKGQKDDSTYRNIANEGDRRRQMQYTLDCGDNYDCRVSIALQKINSRIQKHVGRLNRAGVLDAEMYTISNRDVRSMKLLDQWLHYIDTDEVLPLFEDDLQEYSVPRLDDLQIANIPSLVERVVRRREMEGLRVLPSLEQVRQVLSLLLQLNDKPFLRQVYQRLLEHAADGSCTVDTRLLTTELLHMLPQAVFLVSDLLQSSAWRVYKDTLKDQLIALGIGLLHQLVLLADTMSVMVKRPFKLVLQSLAFLSSDNLADLIELVALTVRRPQVALDLLLECLEAETSRLLVGRPSAVAQLTKNLIGIAINHVDETQDLKPSDGTIQLELDGENEGYAVAKAIIRIDSSLNSLLKTGDHVRLTAAQPPQNAPLDRPFSMAALVFKVELGTAYFRCLHQPPSFVTSTSWKITHCGSFVTAKAMIDALKQFHGEQSACCRLYGPLTTLSGAVVVQHQEIPYQWQQRLNESQNLAVETALKRPLTLLWGPPGTGKTFTVVAILIQLLQSLPKKRILLTAPTHNAVDNILEKFIMEDGVAKTNVQPLRVSTDVKKVGSALQKYTCDAMLGKDLNSSFAALRQAKKRVKESRLVFTTCTGAGLGLLRDQIFEVVLVDEASQQTEPETLIPLIKGCQRAVLVGDHVQLRATVQRNAVATGFDISLFEKHYALPETQLKGKVMLDTQYRMHANICEFSSREFYDGKLKTAVPDASRPLIPSQFPWDEKHRKVFVQCSAPEDIGQQSKANNGQARLCKRVCDLLCAPPKDDPAIEPSKAAFRPSQIAILTPYTRQKELLKALLPSYEISSIDGFQGREAEIIVFVTTRCNVHHDMGFLNDLRRLNVAATRARTGMIVIGDKSTLTVMAAGAEVDESKECWARLLKQCHEVVLSDSA